MIRRRNRPWLVMAMHFRHHGALVCLRIITQLSLRDSPARCHLYPGDDRGDLEASTLRRSMCFNVSARCTTGSVRGDVLNWKHIFMCARSPSSMAVPFPIRLRSSFTASAHRPHTKWPQNFSFVRSM